MRRRDTAQWMALHVSITTGHAVTAAQLLGEAEAEKADRMSEAEQRMAELEQKTGGKMLPAGARQGEVA